MEIVRDAGSTDLEAAHYPQNHKQPAYGQSHRHSSKPINSHPRADDADASKESEPSQSASDEDSKPKSDLNKSPKAEKKETNDETVDDISKTQTTSTIDTQVTFQCDFFFLFEIQLILVFLEKSTQLSRIFLIKVPFIFFSIYNEIAANVKFATNSIELTAK